MSPRGRRPGPGSARGELLAAARAVVAEVGVDKASVRVIAKRAGVDPALIYRFFGNKEGLVQAMLLDTVRPDQILASLALHPGREGAQLARALVAAWHEPALRAGALGILRSATTNDDARARLVALVEAEIADRLRAHIAGPDASTRAGLVLSQLAGLIFGRYVLMLEPLASMSDDEVVRYVAPTLQRYIDGPLDTDGVQASDAAPAAQLLPPVTSTECGAMPPGR